MVVVNTCGFIDAAVAESLDAIGEALAENGKVVVTGCLGAKDGGGFVRAAHPKVLAVTGPHATAEVMAAVHAHLPKPHDPFVDLVPAQGIRLTPKHYAYVKISEGCNHRCTFCIIPSMRGDLVSRPVGDVLLEARRLLAAGVKELLVISQDTSAYGVDVRYRTGFFDGRPVKTRMTELARELDAMARAHGAWVRLHYVYPYPHVDDVIPLMTNSPGTGGLLPYLDIPFQHASPRILKLMKRPAAPEKVLDRLAAWRAAQPRMVVRSTFIVGLSRRDRRRVRRAARLPRGGAARPRRRVHLFAGRRRRRQRAARPGARGREGGAARALHGRAVADQRGQARGARRRDARRARRRPRRGRARPREAARGDRPQRRRRAGDRRRRAHRRWRGARARDVRARHRHRRDGARPRRRARGLIGTEARPVQRRRRSGPRRRSRDTGRATPARAGGRAAPAGAAPTP